jgi:hypothetical protein
MCIDHAQHTHTWNTVELEEWVTTCLDLTLSTYNAVTEYKENNKYGQPWQKIAEYIESHCRNIEVLCRDIQTYEMIKIDLDQVEDIF